jgi:hypothetical protein
MAGQHMRMENDVSSAHARSTLSRSLHQDKQEIVDELHDALKKPDTVLKLKVPADEIE